MHVFPVYFTQSPYTFLAKLLIIQWYDNSVCLYCHQLAHFSVYNVDCGHLYRILIRSLLLLYWYHLWLILLYVGTFCSVCYLWGARYQPKYVVIFMSWYYFAVWDHFYFKYLIATLSRIAMWIYNVALYFSLFIIEYPGNVQYLEKSVRLLIITAELSCNKKSLYLILNSVLHVIWERWR